MGHGGIRTHRPTTGVRFKDRCIQPLYHAPVFSLFQSLKTDPFQPFEHGYMIVCAHWRFRVIYLLLKRHVLAAIQSKSRRRKLRIFRFVMPEIDID